VITWLAPCLVITLFLREKTEQINFYITGAIMDLNKFAVDTNKEQDGVWFYFDDKEESGVLVARAGNKKYNKALERIMKPYKHAIQRKTIEDGLAKKLMTEALVEGILLGWKGIELDGKEVPFSKETAFKILMDEKYHDFKETIEGYSQEIAAFQQEAEEADLKNSKNG